MSSLKSVLDAHQIKRLYHFTDRSNLESIINNGGLYSWKDCEDKGITIPYPGGSGFSRQLDSRSNLENYVRLSFTTAHPMMYVAMKENRIFNPVILEIDPSIVDEAGTLFSDCNATKTGAKIGGSIDDLKRIHFNSVKQKTHFDLPEDEQPYFQAEVLVKNFVPLSAITNIDRFGISIPTAAAAHVPAQQQFQSKHAYTAQITRATPTAFIFLVDQSGSTSRKMNFLGKEQRMSEVIAQIVNQQINELVLRCIKTNDVRHYFDIAVIGYGSEVRSAWGGDLEGKWFVSPQELKDKPAHRLLVREEKRTRKGMQVKEVEKVQWVLPSHDGNLTYVHKAFGKAKELLEEWMAKHKDHDCYPPTIINITDGAFNGASKEHVLQLASELKSMYTNDGNVLLWNIHVTSGKSETILLPTSKKEVKGNAYSEQLCDLSSLLPLRYNDPIHRLKNINSDERHIAMSANTDMSTLIQLMDIGTPTNISKNK